jgi:hypothetical protein
LLTIAIITPKYSSRLKGIPNWHTDKTCLWTPFCMCVIAYSVVTWVSKRTHSHKNCYILADYEKFRVTHMSAPVFFLQEILIFPGKIYNWHLFFLKEISISSRNVIYKYILLVRVICEKYRLRGEANTQLKIKWSRWSEVLNLFACHCFTCC